MLKKILITSSLFLISSTIAFGFERGPYVGVTATGENGTWKLQGPIGNTSFSASGFSGNIFGGLGAVFDRGLYLGGEAFLSTSSTKSSVKAIDTIGTSVKMRTTYGYGISFIPGVKTGAATMIYGRAGLVRTRFEVTQNPSAYPNYLGTTGNTALGTQVGIGIQTSLTSHIDIRGEYDYISYQNFTAFNNRISPSTNQFSLGLVYNFCARVSTGYWLD